MAFIEDALNFLGFEKEITPYSHRITLYGERGAVVEGVRRIDFYSEEKIEFALKKSVLVLNGERLKIKKYGEGEVLVVGNVKGVCYR